MSLIAKDLPSLIFMLIPGFIAAGVFYTLTAHPKTTEFERVIQSLIFTSIIKFLVLFVKPTMIIAGQILPGFVLGRWNADVEFQWSIMLSLVVGMVFVWFANNDLFHSFMRFIRITTRTSYPSEWYGAFKNLKRHVLLELDGERRLKGWVEDWPDQSDKGHFVISEPEWVLDDNQVAPLYEVSRFLIPAKEVVTVQFLKPQEEITASPEEIKRVEKLLMEVVAKGKKEDSSGSQATSTSA